MMNVMSTSTVSVEFAIVPLPTNLANQIRGTLTDQFGNRLAVWESDPVPCRLCLQLTEPGEAVILFAYRPFDFTGPYAEVGPIFVHARPCERYANPGVFPPDFATRVLTMRGYNSDGRIETATLSESGHPEAAIRELFANVRVQFIHVRNPAWGCYDFRVEREGDLTVARYKTAT